MKKNLLLFVLLLSVVTLSAKSRKGDLEVTNHIARPGLTILIVNSNGSIKCDKTIGGSKYNYNDIEDSKRKISTPRYNPYKNVRCVSEEWFEENKIGQRIISYIFNRKKDGTMDDSIVRKRGMYAATTDQKMNADATMLGSKITLQDFGYEMLNNNYVLIIFKNIAGTKKSEAALYNLELPESFLGDESLGKAWILPTDDAATKKEKRAAFEQIEYSFREVTRVKISSTEEFFTSNLNEKIIIKVENRTPAIAPQSPVFSTRPVTSRIGKKENLKNGSRYDSYKYVMRKGEVKAVRTAILRATTIAENQTDNTLLSEFTPVAGFGIKEGYILKQRRDLQSSITPSYRVGAMAGYGFSYDGLLKIKTRGATATGGAYFYAMPYDIMKMAGDNYDYILKQPDLFDSGNWLAFNFGYRGVHAWRIGRFFEPGFAYLLGFESIHVGDNYENYKNTYYSGAITFSPEVVFKMNIAYPVHLVVSAGYVMSMIKFSSDSDFKDKESINNSAFSVLKDLGASRMGLTLSAGLSFSF